MKDNMAGVSIRVVNPGRPLEREDRFADERMRGWRQWRFNEGELLPDLDRKKRTQRQHLLWYLPRVG